MKEFIHYYYKGKGRDKYFAADNLPKNKKAFIKETTIRIEDPLGSYRIHTLQLMDSYGLITERKINSHCGYDYSVKRMDVIKHLLDLAN